MIVEKVLWLSRHPMTQQQADDLLLAVQAKFVFTPQFRPDALEIVTLNVTFRILHELENQLKGGACHSHCHWQPCSASPLPKG